MPAGTTSLATLGGSFRIAGCGGALGSFICGHGGGDDGSGDEDVEDAEDVGDAEEVDGLRQLMIEYGAFQNRSLRHGSRQAALIAVGPRLRT
jgi:hypothetical protein